MHRDTLDFFIQTLGLADYGRLGRFFVVAALLRSGFAVTITTVVQCLGPARLDSMSAPATAPSVLIRLRRCCARLDLRWRALVVGVLGLVAIYAASALYDWWTAWPPRLVLEAPGDNIPLAFAPDSVTLATENEGRIKLWDTRDGRLLQTCANPTGRTIFDGRFTPDGRTFIALTFNRNANPAGIHFKLIDVASSQTRASIESNYGGFLGLAIRDNGRVARLFLSDYRFRRQLLDIDLETGRVLRDRELGPKFLSNGNTSPMSADGRFGVVVFDGHLDQNRYGMILIWDLDGDREAARWVFSPGASSVQGVAFAPDGKSIVIARADGSIEGWDINPDPSHFVYSSEPRRIGRHASSYRPSTVKFSADGTRLTSLGMWIARPTFSLEYLRVLRAMLINRRNYEPPYELLILDPAGGRQVAKLLDEGRAVFSPDGRTLATISFSGPDGSALIRDLPAKR